METPNETKAKEIAGQNCVWYDEVENSKEISYEYSSYEECKKSALQAMRWKEQQIIKRTIDWVQKEATKHIGFNAISEECSLSWDFIDLLVKAMKGE